LTRLIRNGLTNQRVRIEPPPAGVIIYRLFVAFFAFLLPLFSDSLCSRIFSLSPSLARSHSFTPTPPTTTLSLSTTSRRPRSEDTSRPSSSSEIGPGTILDPADSLAGGTGTSPRARSPRTSTTTERRKSFSEPSSSTSRPSPTSIPFVPQAFPFSLRPYFSGCRLISHLIFGIIAASSDWSSEPRRYSKGG
jgi:hypothetical protein